MAQTALERAWHRRHLREYGTDGTVEYGTDSTLDSMAQTAL